MSSGSPRRVSRPNSRVRRCAKPSTDPRHQQRGLLLSVVQACSPAPPQMRWDLAAMRCLRYPIRALGSRRDRHDTGRPQILRSFASGQRCSRAYTLDLQIEKLQLRSHEFARPGLRLEFVPHFIPKEMSRELFVEDSGLFFSLRQGLDSL